MKHFKNNLKVLFFKSAIFLLALVLSTSFKTLAQSKAPVIRLSKADGEVHVKDSSGMELPCTDNLRIFSGCYAATGKKSSVWLNINGKSFLKLGAKSEVEIRKNKMDIDILCKSGRIFFNAKKRSGSKNSLRLFTSSMVTDIRGAKGFIRFETPSHTQLTLSEGNLECVCFDTSPLNTKRIKLKAGETRDFPHEKSKSRASSSVVLFLPKSASDIQEVLNKTELSSAKLKSGKNNHSFLVDTTLIIPPDKTLTSANDISVIVKNGGILNVDGRYKCHGSLTNHGIISVNRQRTLKVSKAFTSDGAIGTWGRIFPAKGLNIFGGSLLMNKGIIESDSRFTVSVSDQALFFPNGGTIINSSPDGTPLNILPSRLKGCKPGTVLRGYSKQNSQEIIR